MSSVRKKGQSILRLKKKIAWLVLGKKNIVILKRHQDRKSGFSKDRRRGEERKKDMKGRLQEELLKREGEVEVKWAAECVCLTGFRPTIEAIAGGGKHQGGA